MTNANNTHESEIIARLRGVIGDGAHIPLHEPNLGALESEMVLDCLESGWVSSVGKYVDRFERELADYTGAKYAIAVVNGTAALHVSLLLADVQPGDEVICPALTFIATPNAIRYCAADPHFVDVSDDTMGICPIALATHLRSITRFENGRVINRKTGRRIAAVVPMHTFGTPVDLDALIEVCDDYRLPVVEDAAESLGSLYRGKHTGTFGLVSAISFNGNKIITAGGGGAILTNDHRLVTRAKHLTTTAKVPHAWEFNHDEVGFNYRMPNLNAALVVAQLSRLADFVNAKQTLHQRYVNALADVEDVTVFEPPAESTSNHWLNCLILQGGIEARNRLLSLAAEQGIGARPIWNLVSEAPMYNACPRADLSVSNRLRDTVVNIPSSPGLAKTVERTRAA